MHPQRMTRDEVQVISPLLFQLTNTSDATGRAFLRNRIQFSRESYAQG
jgi:hypothetical protein